MAEVWWAWQVETLASRIDALANSNARDPVLYLQDVSSTGTLIP